MTNSTSTNPTYLEQIAASTIQKLRLLEAEYSWDFQSAIDSIEFLIEAHEHKVTPEDVLASMREYAEASGREVHQLVALNQDSGYTLPGDKSVKDFFDSVDEMFAPLHSSKEVF